MSDLRERLDRELARVVPPRDARAAVDTRVARRRRRRTVLLPAVTLILTAGLVAGLTFAFRPVPPPGPAQAVSIPMPGEPIQAIVYEDALWAITQGPGCEGPACPGFVVKVDTLKGVVAGQVAVTSPTGLTAGAGSIWLASFADAMLIRLDPETASIDATIPLVLPGEEPGSDWKFLPTHVAANEDGVWVSTARGAVAHIDPATNSVVDVVPLPPETLGGVVIGRDAVWLDNSGGGVIRVDPESHHAEEMGSINDEAGFRLSVGIGLARDGNLWALGTWGRPVEELGEKYYEATDREALVSIEESTGDVSMIIDLPKQPCCASLLIDGDVWLVESNGASLRQLDPFTGDLAEPIPVPFGRPLVVSGTTAWSAVGEGIRRWELPLEHAAPFVPPTRLEGDVVVMPVTLPDGHTVEIVYPPQADLASLGVRAVSFAEPTQAPECAAILYAYHGTDRFLHGEGTPEATYPSATGEPVELWEPPSNVAYPQAWLVFSFGSWRVGVPVQGSCRDDDVLATWARSVTGRETQDGFLVLDTKSPVRTYEPGDPDAPGLIFEDGRFQVQVFATACTPFDDGDVQRIGGKDVHRTEGVAQWCLSEDSILVRIEGDDALIDPLIRDIGIRSVGRSLIPV
jgi:streptogramin lyase